MTHSGSTERSVSGAVPTERNEDGEEAFSLTRDGSSLWAGPWGAVGDSGGAGLTVGAAGTGFGSVTGADGLACGEGDGRAGVSAIASDPENEKSKSITRMLKKAANYTRPPKVGQDPLISEARPQVKRAPEAHRHSTRHAPSRLRPALPPRYVEDGLTPRTNFGKGRVLRVRSLSWQARDGWVE